MLKASSWLRPPLRDAEETERVVLEAATKKRLCECVFYNDLWLCRPKGP
jgi:hypothetical protein